MTPSGQTICLCMIVKNEAPVIRRCLDSVRPLIDHWIVIDTGSTDGTQDIVREHFRDIPGELVERPWRDFAHNRSEALALARPHGDYSLIVDADDAFEVPAGFRMPELDADSYTVDIRDTAITYQRTQLVRNTLPWRYVGVLHEFIACDGAKTTGHLPVVMLRNHDGARRRDPDTYRKDAVILERALETETDPFLRSRYTFYLAQSYRDCGEREKALARYLERADQGYWDQEVFVSLLQAGRLMEALHRPAAEVLQTYGRATEACPSRIEAAHAGSRLCRLANDFVQAVAIAKPALDRPMPKGGLFVEPYVYDYALLDEYAVSSYWIGNYDESQATCERLLKRSRLPAEICERVKKNLAFAAEKVAKQLALLGPAETQVSLRHGPDGDLPVARAGETARRVQSPMRQFKIYRTIHIVWVGDESKRPDNCIASWKQMNPDWNVIVWGNEEMRQGGWRNMPQIRKMVTHEFCGVADMMRWEILERHGGFAIDADSLCVRPLENWLFEPETFACWENEIARPGLIANGYFYSHPHNRLVRMIIDDIARIENVISARAWQLTGPCRLTDTVKLNKYADITIYPSHFFMPRHLSGVTYRGSGSVFAQQFWGTGLGNVYDTLAMRNLNDLAS